VAHACNPSYACILSYWGDRDMKDCGSQMEASTGIQLVRPPNSTNKS
jgi:hypothetical protein